MWQGLIANNDVYSCFCIVKHFHAGKISTSYPQILHPCSYVKVKKRLLLSQINLSEPDINFLGSKIYEKKI